MRLFINVIAMLGLYVLLGPGTAQGQAVQTDLTKIDLADLMNIQVSSVAKKDQKLSRTASAVFVICQADIAHSGATNLPDLLRMVPGLDVAQINSSTWAISARGLNGQYSNKLQVLIDGRTVYSPMFSGVFWDEQAVPLETIERIEVIRGPGATSWGANAVNGVINVITKKAGDTQGGVLSSGGGTYEHGFGYVRYGGELEGGAEYRVSMDGFDRNRLPGYQIQTGGDGWKMIHGEFRVDSRISDRDSVGFQGEAHSGVAGERVGLVSSLSPLSEVPAVLSSRFSGWNLLSKWEHELNPHSKTYLQVSFDRDNRGDSGYVEFGINNFALDFQHHVSWGERQDFVWGVGYRLSSDEAPVNLRTIYTPAHVDTDLYSSFVQDELAVVPDRLYLNIGTKLEHNEYTGFGLAPSARISWTPNERHMFWTAVSQAERTPSRTDTDIRVNGAAFLGPNGIPILYTVFGSPRFRNENLLSYEVGYRTQVSRGFSFDSTTFFNRYKHLASVEPGTPFLEGSAPSEYLVLPNHDENLQHGQTYGFEASASWKVTNRWKLSPGYSFLIAHIRNDSSSNDPTSANAWQESSPDHQAQLRSSVDLTRYLEWNSAANFVSALSVQKVPSYTRFDSNLVWKPSAILSVALVGQNLFKDRHLEFNGPFATVSSSLVKRSAYAKVTWQF